MQVEELPVHARQKIAEIMRLDPSTITVSCEAPGCTASKPLGDMCSMAVVYRMPGPGTSPYQCPDEQHYGCCHEHAILALLKCLVTDIEAGQHVDPKEEIYQHPLLQSIEGELKRLASAS